MSDVGSDGSITWPDPDVIVTLDDDDVIAAIEALRYVLDFGTMPGEETPMRVALEKLTKLWDAGHQDDPLVP